LRSPRDADDIDKLIRLQVLREREAGDKAAIRPRAAVTPA
jgi:hypothetical protein